MMISIFLGFIQGIAEWLPVSSEGILVLTQVWLDIGGRGIDKVHLALFLHLGTFLAALIYFRKDVLFLLKSLFQYKKAKKDIKNLLNFLIFSTLISGFIGFLLLKLISVAEEKIELTGKVVIFAIGVFLLGTAVLAFKAKNGGGRKEKDITWKDTLLLGVVQGFAILPGFSRSGLTVGTLLLRKFDDYFSLRLSFLMSLPVVLGGNIILNLSDLSSANFDISIVYGLITAFIFGLITIHYLLKLAKRIKFAYFVLIFSILTMLSSFI